MSKERKLLRKQLELLAEKSESAVYYEDLIDLSIAMCEVYKKLNRRIFACLTLSSVVGFGFPIGIVILIEKCFGG